MLDVALDEWLEREKSKALLAWLRETADVCWDITWVRDDTST